MESLTVGQLRDILRRAETVISLDDAHDEHSWLLKELRETITLCEDSINSSHMGIAADVVIVERGDA